ncbi:MAG: DNA polymerase III subunit beta [Bdellovibrionota bacterium]
MNFSIAKEKFSHLLYLTHSIVERRNTMPILANVKLNAEDGKLTLAATDLEVSVIGEAEATVKAAGSTTVDAKVLYDIIRELPNEPISVNLAKGQRLEIQCGQSKFKINGTSADEFPSLAGTTISKPVSIEAAMFYEMFDKTSFAVSTDETRYNINGVLVETVPQESGKGHSIRFVATDGHRLALIDRPSEGFQLADSVIVPRKGIQEVKKVLEGNEGAAKVEVRDGFFTVESAGVTLGIRLVDGQFPDYRQVIPAESKTEVGINRVEFLSAVKRVSLVTTDKNKAVRFKVSGDTLSISSSSPEYGEANDSLAVDKQGEDVEIGFSARYIIDLLNAMTDSELITIKLNGDLGPGVFTGSGTEAYTCIVMPMRFE